MMVHDDVKGFLNQLVATQGLLYTRLHQFHWYVNGPHFFTLHEQFEALYDTVTANMDDVAERLIAIGGEPYATLAEFQEHAILEEDVDDKNLSEDEMVEAVVADYQAIRDFLTEGIHLTDEHADFVSNDMLIAMKEDIDKTLWMLQAYLGKRPSEQSDYVRSR